MRKARRRRRLSMTSLIDVIFLLLLFFMLSSTFSKFAEVELSAAVSVAAAPSETPPIFLELASDILRVNGTEHEITTLETVLSEQADPQAPVALLISLKDGVSAQRLTDLLVVLRGIQGLNATVLGGA
ncbi:MAG: biopolymer transporter ExbD [Pseudomonadota bacterium]